VGAGRAIDCEVPWTVRGVLWVFVVEFAVQGCGQVVSESKRLELAV